MKNKSFILQNIKWIFSFFFFLFFLLLAIHIFQKKDFIFDQKIMDFFIQHQSKSFTMFFKVITNFASTFFLIFLCFFIYLCKATRKEGNLVVANLITIVILNYLLKLFFTRERPLGISLIKETGYSFPSGHSATSMAYFGLFIYLIYRSNLRKFIKWILIMLLSLLILLIGISRIYLGVHYPSDVIGGFFLAIAYLILFTHLIFVYRKKKVISSSI